MLWMIPFKLDYMLAMTLLRHEPNDMPMLLHAPDGQNCHQMVAPEIETTNPEIEGGL